MKFNDDAEITHPDRREQDWFYPSDTDYVFLGIFIPVAFVILAFYQFIGLLVDAAVFGLCWTQLSDGRIYYVAGIKFRNFWIFVLRHNVWEAEPKHPLLAKLLRAPPIFRRLAINLVGDLALIYNKKAKTDTLLIGGSGSHNTSFDIYAQARIIERIGEGIKRIASVKNYEVVVGFVNMRRQSNVRRMLEVYAEHTHWDYLPRDPDNPWPPEEDLTPEERGDRNIALVLQDCLASEHDENRTNTMLATITIRRDGLMRKAAKKGGSMADLEEERTLIEEIAEVAESVLMNCGVVDAHAYNFEETHEHLRYIWDVKQDDEYPSWQTYVGDDPEHPDYEYFVKFFHWPRKFIRAFKTWCDLDGSLHAVLRLEENPKEADPMTFLDMFAIDVPNVTVSVVGKTVKSRRTVRILERTTRVEEVFKDSLGVADDTQAAISRNERTQTQLETAHRSRFSQLYNVVVVVSATNRRDLKEYVKVAIRTLHGIDGVYVKRVKGSYLQVPWVLTAHGAPV
jgi:hypothetical protein